MNIIQGKAPNVSLVAHVDDTVLLGPAADVAQAISKIQVETATGANCKKLRRKSGPARKPPLTMNFFFALLQGDKRGILMLGETVSGTSD